MSKSVADLIAEAERRLSEARRLVAEEIAFYPTPISGCDAQFNHLIVERERIGAALVALRRDIFVPTPRTPSRHSGVESR